MAKLKGDAVKLKDMEEYLNSTSDFAFEMRVLKLLNDKYLETTFGGLYQDPNTNQTRQFDIRSNITLSGQRDIKHFVKLAIECKNLRNNFPLLISGTKRKDSESVIDTWYFELKKRIGVTEKISLIEKPSYFVSAKTLQPSKFYKSEFFVGRSCVQVGRGDKNDIEASDSEVYNKWTQALCSLYGLMQFAAVDIERQVTQQGISYGHFVFIPIVVIPDEMLWIVEYSDNGELLETPKQVEKCSYWVNKRYSFSAIPCEYTVSHMEFMTFTGLKKFLDNPILHWRILNS